MERRVAWTEPLDLPALARPLSAGWGDPTQRASDGAWARATRTPEGPATLAVVRERAALRLEAWGPGAAHALDAAPELLGLHRPPPDPGALPPRIRRLARAAPGLRLVRTRNWLEPLVLLVLQQKVSGKEAARSFRALVHAASEPAPGPFEALWLPPDAERLARLPDWSFAPLGISARQGALLRRVAGAQARVQALRGRPVPDALAGLTALPGIGPWTASSLLLLAGGEPDVVPVGDLHLPSIVAWNLAGERRADDRRMLELLAPFRGLRGWLARWIEASGEMPPRRQPRPRLRDLPDGHAGALAKLRTQLRG